MCIFCYKQFRIIGIVAGSNQTLLFHKLGADRALPLYDRLVTPTKALTHILQGTDASSVFLKGSFDPAPLDNVQIQQQSGVIALCEQRNVKDCGNKQLQETAENESH